MEDMSKLLDRKIAPMKLHYISHHFLIYLVCGLFLFLLGFACFRVHTLQELCSSWFSELCYVFFKAGKREDLNSFQLAEMGVGKSALWASVLASVVAPTFAINLFTTHYSGNVSTLSLTRSGNKFSLTKTSSITSCGGMPSWLTYDSYDKTLYCSDESFSPNGSLWTYSVNSHSGALTPITHVTTLAGGVNSVQYGGSSGKGYLAIAH
jgi:hypothetical protein